MGYAIAAAILMLGCAGPAKEYFGHIQTVRPCNSGDHGCDEFRDLLVSLEECGEADAKCRAGDDLLRKIFGDTYRPAIPDYIVYLEQGAVTPERRQFIGHLPVLLWNHKNTPFLYGVRDVYVVVFTERRVCLEGRVTTTYRSDPNPFSGLLTALGAKNADSATPKTPERTEGQFKWYPLSGDRDNTGMWFAIARFGVDENSTVRITVEYSQPKLKKATAGTEKGKSTGGDRWKSGNRAKNKSNGSGSAEIFEECLTEEGDADAATPPTPPPTTPASPKDQTYWGDFLAANGFISNSPSSCATVSFALGGSYNVQGTTVASGGSKVTFNGYALAKFYLMRPRILASSEANGGRRPSVGLFVGTGIKSPFDELVFGLSLGHLVGNAGLVAGGNSIAGAKDSTHGRKMCPFGGIDYSF